MAAMELIVIEMGTMVKMEVPEVEVEVLAVAAILAAREAAAVEV
jgi:hypothetical protein